MKASYLFSLTIVFFFMVSTTFADPDHDRRRGFFSTGTSSSSTRMNSSSTNDRDHIGITGTPGFLISYYDPSTELVRGELLSGTQPTNAFQEKINYYLAQTTN